MEKTVIELFAGVGGFRVGLNRIRNFNEKTGLAIENGNWDFVWANQWEPSTKVQPAFDCYKTRFGSKEVSNIDISQVNKEDIPDHSLLVGGFPCQDYSVARSKSTEKGIEGIKGVLFWDIASILEVKNTPFFLLENVDRLLKSPASQRGRDFGIMLRTITDLGYNLEWRVINAAEYGRGQRRRRVFLFGWKRNTNYNNQIIKKSPEDILHIEGLFAKRFPVENNTAKKLHSVNISEFKDTVEMTEKFKYAFENSGVILDDQVYTTKTQAILEAPIPLRENLEDGITIKDHMLTGEHIAKFEKLRGSKKIPRKKPNGEVYYYSEGSMSPFDSLDLPARTMLTSERSTNRSTHIIMDPQFNSLRYLTPLEAERLQDFPDNWTNTGMSTNRRFFMMGNALVTGIIERLEVELAIIIENEK